MNSNVTGFKKNLVTFFEDRPKLRALLKILFFVLVAVLSSLLLMKVLPAKFADSIRNTFPLSMLNSESGATVRN